MKGGRGESGRSVGGWLARRILWLGVLWWVLTENRWADWGLVLVTVGLAAWTSLWLWPARAWDWKGRAVIGFAPYFLYESLLGGLDVARRALHPDMRLEPEVIEYSLRWVQGPGVVCFVWVVSLLPGTAAIEIEPGRVRVHVLDRRQPVTAKLEALERRVSGLFRDRISPGGTPL